MTAKLILKYRDDDKALIHLWVYEGNSKSEAKQLARLTGFNMNDDNKGANRCIVYAKNINNGVCYGHQRKNYNPVHSVGSAVKNIEKFWQNAFSNGPAKIPEKYTGPEKILARTYLLGKYAGPIVTALFIAIAAATIASAGLATPIIIAAAALVVVGIALGVGAHNLMHKNVDAEESISPLRMNFM